MGECQYCGGLGEGMCRGCGAITQVAGMGGVTNYRAKADEIKRQQKIDKITSFIIFPGPFILVGILYLYAWVTG